MPRCLLPVSLVLLLIAQPAVAAGVGFGGVRIDLPAQYSGPVRKKPNPTVETMTFVMFHQSGVPSDNVVLTRYEFGDKIPQNLSDDDLEKGATQYLLQTIDSIGKARSSYTQTEPHEIRLGGRVGSQSSWTGFLQGAPTNGKMYCLIVGTQVVIIHAFGGGDHPSKDLTAAMHAIESLTLDHG